MSYHNSFGLPLTIARPFNTYGPRQSARAIIPTLISQMLAGNPEIRVGDLRPTRDLNFVLDTCEGLVKLGACDAAVGKTVNIGSNFEVSMQEVFERLLALTGSIATPVVEDERKRPQNSEVFRLWCDNALITELTGFKPHYDLKNGLSETVAWFRNPENLARYKSDIYVV